MASAQSIQQAVQAAEGRQSNQVAWLVEGGRKVLQRHQAALESGVGDVPLSLVAVRIWHEARGNPKALSREHELGLLQIYASTAANFAEMRGYVSKADKWRWNADVISSMRSTVTGPWDPALNISVGCKDWANRARWLAKRHASVWGGERNLDFWAAANSHMSIGGGATTRLISHVGGGFSAVMLFIRTNPGGFAALPAGWWGVQSAELVAARCVMTERFMLAAQQISPVESGIDAGAAWGALAAVGGLALIRGGSL